MDIEFLFSANPFVAGGGQEQQQFSFVRPNHVLKVLANDSVELVGDADLTHEIIIQPPPEVQACGRDYIVEITSRGLRATVPVFRSRMKVNITETTGRLRVTLGGRSAARCYVKVYWEDKHTSAVRFYKDGYRHSWVL